MNNSLLKKPWKHGKWLIWENTVLNRIYLSDCNDTINGICLKDKTVKECLNECAGECGAGYHIDFGNGKSICVPIRTDIHKNLNPVYRLRKQSMYPDLDGTKVSTFINTEKYLFPPDAANVVFYQDLLTMINTHNGYSLGNNINEQIENGSLIYMEKVMILIFNFYLLLCQPYKLSNINLYFSEIMSNYQYQELLWLQIYL